MKTYSKEQPHVDVQWSSFNERTTMEESVDEMDQLGSSLLHAETNNDQIGDSIHMNESGVESDVNADDFLEASNLDTSSTPANCFSFTTSTPIKDRSIHGKLPNDFPSLSFNEEDGDFALDLTEDISLDNISSFALSTSSSTDNNSTDLIIDSEVFHDVKSIIPKQKIMRSPIAASAGCKKELDKHTRISMIQLARKRGCCIKLCSRKFTLLESKNMRMKYWQKKPFERHQWLLDKFTEVDLSKRHFVLTTEKGVSVCIQGFLLLYGINKTVFYSVRRSFLKGKVFCNGVRMRNRSSAFLTALNWLETYASFHGDRMPTCAVVYLPYRTKKINVYIRYTEEVQSSNLKRATFYRMWDTSFPNLKIKEVNSFAKCTKCSSIERQIENTTNPLRRAKLLSLREEHHKRQMEERKYYYKKRDMAKSTPSRYLSVIIDGMDQAKTNLPHFVGRSAKAVHPKDKLATHVSGVIAHGQNKFCTFLDWGQYPHDSNLTINILLMMLQNISQQLEGKLPAVLFIQADNCWRENKNRYVLAFAELLVHLKMFQEVHLSFLMVGHTHEDVDAAFSKIACSLRLNDAETYPDLLKLLPNCKEIVWLYNVRDWLSPCLNDIRKHTKPLHFKFCRDQQTNDVSFFYKARSGTTWKSEIGLLQIKGNGRPMLPTGVPKLILPLFTNIPIQNLETRLPYWQCLFSDQISNAQLNSWKQHVIHLKKLRDNVNYQKKEIFSRAQWILPKLPRLQTTNQDETSGHDDVPAAIRQLMNDEIEDHEIVVINRVKRPKKT